MVMLNDLDRFHLVMDVIDRVPGLGSRAARAAPADGRRAPARAAPTRASDGRGPARGARTGPGRTPWRELSASPRRQRRVEQPEAARCSTSDDALLGSTDLPGAGHGRRGRAAARARRTAGAIDAVGHRIVHGGSELHEPVVVDDDVARAAARRSPIWRRCTSRKSLARARRRSAGCCPDVPAGRAASTPPSTPRSRPPPRPTPCRPSGASAGAAPLRLPRALPRLRLAPRRRAARTAVADAADRHLPPRRRRVAGGRRGGRVGRHHDGLHAARRPGDGDPLGLGRPRADALAAEHGRHLARRARGRARAPLRPARPGRQRRHARACSRAERRGRRGAELGVDVYLHRLRAGDRRDGRRAWAGSTRWSSPAASARTRPASARAPRPASASSASPSTRTATPAPSADAEIGPAGAAVRAFVIRAREDLEIARGVRRALGSRKRPR